MIHVFDVLAQTVAQEGTDICFALLGDANMAFATRLSEAGCRLITLRHEHCAAAAAMAYTRKSGRIGLVTVTCGPGVTQLMTALPAAVRARLPMVVIAGEAPLRSGWYNQAIDQAPFVAATGAAYHALHWPARMPVAIRDAFLQARREQRPVVLGIPFDLQEQRWDGAVRLPTPSAAIMPQTAPQPPNPSDLTAAIARIGRADRIIVMAGLGAAEAGAVKAARSLAARLDALLATTLPARGLFWDDPFSIGIAGGFSSDIARACFAEADLVIGLGSSLARHTADSGTLWPKADILQIDTDPVAIAQGRRAASHHLRADARLATEALVAGLPARPTHWRSAALAERIANAPADAADFPSQPGLHDPREVVAALDAAIPQGWQLVNSSGHCSYFFAQMPRRPFADFLTIREFGAIGNGTSFALGVAAAYPDRPVVLCDGDGSLLMHVQELESILRHDMPVLIAVMNDGAYGSEIHKLRAEGLSDAGARFGRSDLAEIARGFGANGARVNDLGALPALIEQFDRTRHPMLLDFPVSDRVVSPVIRRSHGL